MNALWLSRQQWAAVGAALVLLVALAIIGILRTTGGEGHLVVPTVDTVEAVVGETTATQVVLTNDGDGALDIASVAVLPASGSGFTIDGGSSCSNQIPDGESCSLTLLFSPQAVRTHGATLIVEAGERRHELSLSGIAFAGPLLQSSGDDGQFGTIQSGALADPRTVTVANTGDRPLDDLTADVVGEMARSFRVTSSCGARLDPGEACSLTIHFVGFAVARHEAQLVVEGAGAGHAISLAAIVVEGPALDIVGPGDFEPQLVDTASPAKDVVVTNSGDTPLDITGIALRGTDDAAFSLVDAARCVGQLDPGTECRFAVTFGPSSRGQMAAELLIGSDSEEVVVDITGQGIVAGFVQFDRFDGDFGVVSVGAPADAGVVLRNAGDTDVSNLRTDVTGDGFHVVSHTCGSTLAPSESCDAVLRFDPSVPGAHQGALVVTPSTRLPLAGVAVVGVAEFDPVSPSEAALYDFRIDFDAVTEGTESAPKTITVTNTGQGELEIASLVLSPSNHFRLEADTCTARPLAPGDTCRFDLVFAPTLSGAKTAFLEITYAVGTGPVRGYATGTGTEASEP